MPSGFAAECRVRERGQGTPQPLQASPEPPDTLNCVGQSSMSIHSPAGRGWGVGGGTGCHARNDTFKNLVGVYKAPSLQRVLTGFPGAPVAMHLPLAHPRFRPWDQTAVPPRQPASCSPESHRCEFSVTPAVPAC